MNIFSILLAILIVASWGLNAAIGKMGVSELPPLLFISIRFSLTALIFIPFAKVDKKQLIHLFFISLVLNVGHMGGIFVALKHLSASAFSVLQQLQVPLSMILSFLILHEKISKLQVLGVVISFTGLFFIFGMPDVTAIGLIALAVGCFAWGFTQLLFKQAPKFDSCAFMGYSALFCVPFLFLGSLLFESVDYTTVFSNISYKVYISLSYQVILMSIAMLLWQRLIQKNGVAKVTPFNLLQVVFGILGGMILFNESLTFGIVGGTLLITTGIALNIIKCRKMSN